MLSVETYSMWLIFYTLIGVPLGVSAGRLDTRDKQVLSKWDGGYYLSGLVGLGYAFAGLRIIGGGHPIYIYVPALFLWLGGKYFGRTLYPAKDGIIAIVVIVSSTGAMALFHAVL